MRSEVGRAAYQVWPSTAVPRTLNLVWINTLTSPHFQRLIYEEGVYSVVVVVVLLLLLLLLV